MTALFWLALVLGGGLALLSVAGDFFDTDGHSHAGVDGDAWHILSLRSATYFLFCFGAVGLLSRSVGAGMVLAGVAATLTGVAAALGATAVLNYVRRTETGGFPTDESFVGLTGTVVMPLVHGGNGKIMVRRAGRDIELLARAFEPDATRTEEWTEVLVVDITAGTALVTQYVEGSSLPSSTE